MGWFVKLETGLLLLLSDLVLYFVSLLRSLPVSPYLSITFFLSERSLPLSLSPLSLSLTLALPSALSLSLTHSPCLSLYTFFSTSFLTVGRFRVFALGCLPSHRQASSTQSWICSGTPSCFLAESKTLPKASHKIPSRTKQNIHAGNFMNYSPHRQHYRPDLHFSN